MSQPLVYFRSDNHYQSPFTSTPFMQNQYSSSNGFQEPSNGIIHKPLPPKRSRRKRKLEETDIEDPDINDSINDNLIFLKPSNKRRRTNQMNSLNKQNPAIFQKELEQNIYNHNQNNIDSMSNKNGNRNKNKNIDGNTNKNTNNKNTNNKNKNDDRMETPYSDLIHPYLVNKNNDKRNNDKEESPEYMLSKLNLNSFKMKNTENESVNDWRDSIESQLKSARNQTSNIEELCQRINNTSGLGRDILMAKLRKSLTNDTFQKICHIMRYH